MSKRCVDGVEVDAAIQDERAVNLISTQKTTFEPVAGLAAAANSKMWPKKTKCVAISAAKTQRKMRLMKPRIGVTLCLLLSSAVLLLLDALRLLSISACGRETFGHDKWPARPVPRYTFQK